MPPPPRLQPDHATDGEAAAPLAWVRRLDDDQPFRPDPDLRRRAEQRGRQRRRRHRSLASIGSAALVVVVLAGTLGGYGRWQASRIVRISMAEIPQVDAAGQPSPPPPPATGTAPFTVLVVGTDTRPPGDEVSGTRADTVMLVRVDRAAGTVRMASLPRDLWVPIGDRGTSERLNTAIQDGPATLVRTVNRVFGIPIDHVVQVDFVGFENLVDGIGGVPVQFDAAVSDPTDGLDQAAGCRVLDGSQALALARSRHLQVRDAAGRWTEDPTSDLGRQRRQQVLGEALVRQAGRRATSPAALADLARLAGDNLVLDDQLGVRDLLDLAGWVRDLDPTAVTAMIPAVHDTWQGNAAVLELDPDAASATRDFLLTPAPPADPSGPTGGDPGPLPAGPPTGVTPAVAPVVRVPHDGC